MRQTMHLRFVLRAIFIVISIANSTEFMVMTNPKANEPNALDALNQRGSLNFIWIVHDTNRAERPIAWTLECNVDCYAHAKELEWPFFYYYYSRSLVSWLSLPNAIPFCRCKTESTLESCSLLHAHCTEWLNLDVVNWLHDQWDWIACWTLWNDCRPMWCGKMKFPVHPFWWCLSVCVRRT